jgi:hypothetical protein
MMDAKINKNVAPKIRKLALQLGMCLVAAMALKQLGYERRARKR